MTAAIGGRTWASLSVYESTELVQRFAEERIGRRPNSTKAREIAAHFSQGREYFRSAAGSGELVRPLILYYGVVALARGAALFLDREKSKLVAGHGLDAVGWGDLLANPAAVPDLQVAVAASGTFAELARTVGNHEWARIRTEGGPGVADARVPGPEVRPGTTLTVKEILGQIPDVAELYGRTFAEHSRRLRCEVLITGLPEHRGEVPPDQEVRRHAWLGLVPQSRSLGFPREGWAEDLVSNGRLSYTGNEGFLHFASEPNRAAVGRLFELHYDAGSENYPRLELPVTTLPSGEEYLKLPTDGGVVLSTLLALHLVAYAAGMLVRYHPGYWAMLTGRTKGDSIAPVLSVAVSAVEERYPSLILEAIGG